ncbi:4a-hydroxytetrahydrobiopterin dehydratase [Candidatus Daviesbacteria bacterium]|nr:4a-hydroxytetrahydrobiopterin dehydratase [Candidatus Daviesbacteria bacterium]
MTGQLSSKKCVPCEIGTPPLTAEEIKPLKDQLKLDWEVIEGKKLKREFKFKTFMEAINFVNKIAKIAEEEGHHPDIYIYYNRVVISLMTHNIRGLSENDFILAAKIEDLS